jgi:hypothetical protein
MDHRFDSELRIDQRFIPQAGRIVAARQRRVSDPLLQESQFRSTKTPENGFGSQNTTDFCGAKFRNGLWMSIISGSRTSVRQNTFLQLRAAIYALASSLRSSEFPGFLNAGSRITDRRVTGFAGVGAY